MAKGKASEEPRAPGATTIAPNVLVTIAQLTAVQVDGVLGLGTVPAGVNQLFRRGIGDGVDLRVQDGQVSADIYLDLKPGANVREVSRHVQQEIARAIEEMVGMQVASINVHIQDIVYGNDAN